MSVPFKSVTDRVVAHPRVYDLVQTLAGARVSNAKLAPHIAATPPDAVVLDVGGGTGRLAALWPPSARYACLDPDPVKLQGFRARCSHGRAVAGDGARLPIRTGSVDVALAIGITHHLELDVFRAVLAEARRVLAPGGRLIYLEPIDAPKRPISRLLWHYDRGAFPRDARTLDALLREQFHPLSIERYAIFHEYLLWVGGPT